MTYFDIIPQPMRIVTHCEVLSGPCTNKAGDGLCGKSKDKIIGCPIARRYLGQKAKEYLQTTPLPKPIRYFASAKQKNVLRLAIHPHGENIASVNVGRIFPRPII
jgi:hypothetical protein